MTYSNDPRDAQDTKDGLELLAEPEDDGCDYVVTHSDLIIAEREGLSND